VSTRQFLHLKPSRCSVIGFAGLLQVRERGCDITLSLVEEGVLESEVS
jgi:hypothetical protein